MPAFTPATKRLLYIADPMCSWCYGFAPVIDALSLHFESRLPIGLLMGGLRPGNTHPMDDDLKASMRGHWQHVHDATGQRFDFSFFDRDGFVYDTEPASRAIVVVRKLFPRLTLSFLHRVQEAFYADGRDVTQTAVLAELADEAGIDPDTFTAAFTAPDARNDTMRDFLVAQDLGIRGFPTLLAGSQNDGFAVVTNGFRPLDGMAEALERWLAGTIH